MTPQHAMFRTVFGICSQIEKTFDYLPDAKTKYPFIYIGDAYDNQRINHDVIGEMLQTVHIYGLRTQRSEIDKIVTKLHDEMMILRQSNGYGFHVKGFSYQSTHDNTDVQPLIHGIIDITYTYSK